MGKINKLLASHGINLFLKSTNKAGKKVFYFHHGIDIYLLIYKKNESIKNRYTIYKRLNPGKEKLFAGDRKMMFEYIKIRLKKDWLL